VPLFGIAAGDAAAPMYRHPQRAWDAVTYLNLGAMRAMAPSKDEAAPAGEFDVVFPAVSFPPAAPWAAG